MPGNVDIRLAALGLALPPPPAPIGRFRHGRIESGLLFMSGQGPLQADGVLATGRVGDTVSSAEAREHARLAGLVLLSAMQAELGTLDRVGGIVKLLGFVNATPDFAEHAQVIDGCSELFHEVFAERADHARSAIGVASLPGSITVEIEVIVSLR